MPDSLRQAHITFTKPAQYRIVVEGPLDRDLSERLAGMRIISSIRKDETWVTILRGRVCDQAELNGVINALYDLHLPMISVQAIGAQDESGSRKEIGD